MVREKPHPQDYPSKEEIASDAVKQYEKDDRDLNELLDEKEEIKKKQKIHKEKTDAVREIVDDFKYMLDNLPEEAETIAKNQPNEKEKDYENAIRRLKQKIDSKYYQRPSYDIQKMGKISYLIIGGKIKEQDKEPEEVL